MSLVLSLLEQASGGGGLPRIVLDYFDVGSKSVAIIGGIFVASKGVIELQRSREQRKQELRWKKASMAREFIKDIHANEHAMAAIEMLDWGDGLHDYCPKKDCEIKIGEEDVKRALALPRNEAVEQVDEYVWESFDWLLYYIDRLEHHIDSKLLKFADVRDVFRPYAAKLSANRQRYEKLIKSQDYRNIDAFLERFQSAEAKRTNS